MGPTKKNEKKTSMKFLFLSFAVTRLKIGPIEKCGKKTLVLHKMATPALDRWTDGPREQGKRISL